MAQKRIRSINWDEDEKNLCIETIEDVEAQVNVQDITPLMISQDNATVDTPMESNMDTVQAKISQGKTIMATPTNKNMGPIQAKKVPKRKILMHKIPENGLKLRKDHDDYVNSMLSHSKMLKDEEHMRRMEMAEEEHHIKMEIYKQKIKCASEEHTLKMEIHKEKLKLAISEREYFKLNM